jgi:flagellin-like hook-associated protein FlgL
MISSDAISLGNGDVVSFDWQSTGENSSAGDRADIYAYLLNIDDGTTIEIADSDPTLLSGGDTGTQPESVTLTAGQEGMYKFVFVAGSYDGDGGSVVGNKINITNLSVTDTGNDSTTSSASSTIEAQESSAVSISRSLLANLDTVASSDGNSGSYSLSGADSSSFTIDQATGNITSSSVSQTSSPYEFTVTYNRSDGGYHKENVTLNLTPALFATTTTEAQESDSVTIALDQMSALNTYVSSNPGGVFSISSSGSDYSNFSIDSSTGVITSGVLDYDTQSTFNFDVLYTVGGQTFTNSIILNLTDTLSSTTSVTVEETDQLTVNYSDLNGTLDFVSRNPGGVFTLDGADAAMFTLDGSNNLVSTSGLYLAEASSRTVQLLYTVGGVTHTDTVTINITEALQAESSATVADGSSLTITPSATALSKIFAYAEDNSGGTWSLASNASDPLDYLDFSINSSNGQITSNAPLNYSTESSHIFDVLYTNGGITFTETLTITVADPTQASSVTNITAEETDALTIPSTNFSSTTSFVSSNPGGTYSLAGADAGSFEISNSGEVTSKSGVSLRIGSTDPYNYYDTYNFNVVYTAGGLTNTEAVILTVNETLESSHTVEAAESDEVSITPSSFITNFAARDRSETADARYSLSSISGDHALFNVDGDGGITSAAALDYDTQQSYSFDLSYAASDGRIFIESIVLNLTDTLTSTAEITTEETESLTIPISQLTSSQTYQAAKPGGTFSLSGTDAGYFDVNSSTGEIGTKSGQSLVQTDKSSYSVTLNYLDTFGVTHSEVITITLTEALQGTSAFSADESDLVTIFLDDLTKIRGFASRDGNNGSFSLGGTDAASFTINSDGNLDSNGALDFSSQETYVFTLSYTESAASGSDTFVDTITLTLNDTLTSTATVTAEETEALTIAANEFTSTATYASRNPGTPAGTYSLTGTDAASFSVDASGNITSTGELRYLTQSSYNFNILYTADGITHTEAVTLNLTQSTYGISATNATVVEAEQVTLANSLMSYLNAFASADSYGGSFSLGTATTNSANDYVNFEVDSTGNINSKSAYNIDYDNGQTSFDMDVTYTHSDGVQTYTDRLHIDLANDYSDDTDLVLASVDISTSAGAREAMNSIGSVIDRMSKTQVILGAKKVQLASNIERLSAVLIQTQIARGRIFDADAVSEASRLAKQQILAGAASQMISLASEQKRGLIDMLI